MLVKAGCVLLLPVAFFIGRTTGTTTKEIARVDIYNISEMQCEAFGGVYMPPLEMTYGYSVCMSITTDYAE